MTINNAVSVTASKQETVQARRTWEPAIAHCCGCSSPPFPLIAELISRLQGQFCRYPAQNDDRGAALPPAWRLGRSMSLVGYLYVSCILPPPDRLSLSIKSLNPNIIQPIIYSTETPQLCLREVACAAMSRSPTRESQR